MKVLLRDLKEGDKYQDHGDVWVIVSKDINPISKLIDISATMENDEENWQTSIAQDSLVEVEKL